MVLAFRASDFELMSYVNIYTWHTRLSASNPADVRVGLGPLALLPGSFHPLHRGHTVLAAVAAARLGVPVHFELSVTNADKPELPRDEVERRLAQFAGFAPVWLTRAATFEAES